MMKDIQRTFIWLLIFVFFHEARTLKGTSLKLHLQNLVKQRNNQNNVITHNNQNFTDCPSVEVDPDEDILLPHPRDCRKFYKCTFGRKVVMTCPDNLYFNAEARYCDWPRNVNCTGKEGNTSPPPPCENCCPIVEEDPAEDILLPHPKDCRKFYKCTFGRKVVMTCPDNLYFNPEARYCDWPDNVNCTGKEVNPPPTPPPTGENSCPVTEKDPAEDILLPHEYDCTTFYKCSHGKKVPIPCPPGLYFSNNTKRCDWPKDSNCTNTCPVVAENPTVDVLFPDERNCSIYYKCSFGKKVAQSCPSELLYNHQKRWCDWPKDVHCYTITEYNAVKKECPQVEKDPQVDILLPHETDCNKFYKCNLGKKVLQLCPSGLCFNAKVNYCDWPKNI